MFGCVFSLLPISDGEDSIRQRPRPTRQPSSSPPFSELFAASLGFATNGTSSLFRHLLSSPLFILYLLFSPLFREKIGDINKELFFLGPLSELSAIFAPFLILFLYSISFFFSLPLCFFLSFFVSLFGFRPKICSIFFLLFRPETISSARSSVSRS